MSTEIAIKNVISKILLNNTIDNIYKEFYQIPDANTKRTAFEALLLYLLGFDKYFVNKEYIDNNITEIIKYTLIKFDDHQIKKIIEDIINNKNLLSQLDNFKKYDDSLYKMIYGRGKEYKKLFLVLLELQLRILMSKCKELPGNKLIDFIKELSDVLGNKIKIVNEVHESKKGKNISPQKESESNVSPIVGNELPKMTNEKSENISSKHINKIDISTKTSSAKDEQHPKKIKELNTGRVERKEENVALNPTQTNPQKQSNVNEITELVEGLTSVEDKAKQWEKVGEETPNEKKNPQLQPNITNPITSNYYQLTDVKKGGHTNYIRYRNK